MTCGSCWPTQERRRCTSNPVLRGRTVMRELQQQTTGWVPQCEILYSMERDKGAGRSLARTTPSDPLFAGLQTSGPAAWLTSTTWGMKNWKPLRASRFSPRLRLSINTDNCVALTIHCGKGQGMPDHDLYKTRIVMSTKLILQTPRGR
jgi:hypothetical protein